MASLSFLINETVVPVSSRLSTKMALVALSQKNIPDGKENFVFKEIQDNGSLKRLFYVGSCKDKTLYNITVLDMAKKGTLQVLQARQGKTAPEGWIFEKAATYTIASTFEGWTPQTIAAQLTASAPAISGTTLSWTAVDGAYCYAVCKDGAVIDFTTATSYVVTDETASYSIRVANQMGGLGEASDTATGVNNVNGNSNGNIQSVEKVIEAGRLVIKKGDKTYTAAGQQTK
jgi:hypothetical protein